MHHSRIKHLDARVFRWLRNIEFDRTQTVVARDYVYFKFSFNAGEFLSSAVRPSRGHYATERFYKCPKVSLGSATSAGVGDAVMSFSARVCVGHSSLSCRNLVFCKYLNLRNSSFGELDVQYLLLLEYIDLAFTKIRLADLRPCVSLTQVVLDQSQ